MATVRHLLVWTFAGGCLCGGVVIGVVGIVREDARTLPQVTPNARNVERHREPTSADPAEEQATDDSTTATDDSAAPEKVAEIDEHSQKETGSSVAELLIRLEAAYREGVAAAPPQSAAATPPAPPHEVAAQEKTAVAALAPAAPPTNAHPAAAPPPAVHQAAPPPARASEAEAQPLLASNDDARPRDVHIGDVNQTTNVKNTFEGDIYVIEQVPYFRYYPYAPAARYVPPTYAPSQPKRRYTIPDVPLPSTVNSFDKPSPFSYPVELVH